MVEAVVLEEGSLTLLILVGGGDEGLVMGRPRGDACWEYCGWMED